MPGRRRIPRVVLARRLHAETIGEGESLVLVHGFTQTARSWDGIVARLRGRYRITLVDAPGHGGSADVHVSLAEAAEMMADQCGVATYIGYSMGARLCLHVATQRPDVVERLVLLSGTAGLSDPVERADRRQADEALAATIERDGVESFLNQWLAQPMFAGVVDADGRDRDRADRLRNTAGGLAASLRLCGTGAQDSLWHRSGDLDMPVLIMAGERDAKFMDLGRRMTARIGGGSQLRCLAEFAGVSDAGHAAHLEQPDTFVGLLTDWLTDHPTSPRHH